MPKPYSCTLQVSCVKRGFHNVADENYSFLGYYAAFTYNRWRFGETSCPHLDRSPRRVNCAGELVHYIPTKRVWRVVTSQWERQYRRAGGAMGRTRYIYEKRIEEWVGRSKWVNEGGSSFETSENYCKATRRHSPEDSTLYISSPPLRSSGYHSYSAIGRLQVQMLTRDRISWLWFSWFPWIPLGKCWNSSSNYATTASFHCLSASVTSNRSNIRRRIF
jgi:hypothetical protein